jgi:hypothetical protein
MLLQRSVPLTVTTISFLTFGGLVAADARFADGIVAALAVIFGVMPDSSTGWR